MSNKAPLYIPAAIDGIRTRKDKSLAISISTQELNPATAARLMTEWVNGIGVMAFKPEQFTAEEEKALESMKLDAEEMGGKTPSMRLRASLYVLYEQKPNGHKSFATFYEAHMEQFINRVKQQLD